MVMPQDKKLSGVLVIDDEPLVLRYTTSVISGLGYEKVFRAPNLQAAQTLVDTESIALIIADVSLPDGDGREFLCKAMRQFPQTAGVLITGFSRADLKLPDELAGRVLLLQKPFTADDITGILAEVFERPATVTPA